MMVKEKSHYTVAAVAVLGFALVLLWGIVVEMPTVRDKLKTIFFGATSEMVPRNQEHPKGP